MKKMTIIRELTKALTISKIEDEIPYSANSIAEYLYIAIEGLKHIKPIETQSEPHIEQALFDVKQNSIDDRDEVFVDEMYALYPTKCPKRNTSLGKSRKDKVKIKRLLKTYTKEEIERVIRHEVDSNYGVNYMKNFSTFLNNFPEPKDLPAKNVVVPMASTSDVVIVDGVIYR